MADEWVAESRVEVDGRTVAVRESGDPDGSPVVFFHGTPSCRLETAFADGICAELGIRMISFDRPGYGGSAAAPFGLASIARDTGVVADILGVQRFVTLGQSGGGPFSLACAAVLGERIPRAGVTAGSPPFSEMPGLWDLLEDNDRKAVDLLPDREAAAAQFAAGFEPFRELGRGTDEDLLAVFKQMGSPRDAQLFDDPELGACLAAAARASLAHGTSGGGWDNVAWVGPWDVDLDEVRQPVHLWYGDEDRFVPPGTGEWLDARLPTATLVVRRGEGHASVMEHAREILETLVSG